MPKHSILQKEVLSNTLPRNAFDLSFRRLFTADAGQLLPIYTEHVNPNEKFSISPSVFLRCQTLNTSAFARMKQNVDFFFVPYRLLSQILPQYLVGTDFVTSSLYDNSVSDLQMPMFRCGSSTNKVGSGLYPINKFGYLPSFSGSNASTLASQFHNPLAEQVPNVPTFKSKKDMFGFDRASLSSSLMQLLGYGASSVPNGFTTTDVDNNYGVSPLPIFAYNKIYMDFYRNPLIENYDNRLCNFDNCWHTQNAYVTSNHWLNANAFASLGLFDMKYHNYKMDFFTHQFTDFRFADFLNTSYSAPVFPLSNNGKSSDRASDSSTQAFVENKNGQISISNLRSAYALDKLLAVSQNAKDGSYNSQIAAHFGFEPRIDSQKVRFIGSVDAPITISEVEGTATTTQSKLGQIAGKGVSITDGRFEFETTEHGIIMGIFYILPELDYQDYGVDPFNLKVSRSDFFQPEFADLGLQPTPLSLLSSEQFNFSNGSNVPMNPNTTIFGYTNRYSEYKSRIDKVDGNFLDSLNAWTIARSLSVGGRNGAVSPVLNLAFTKVNPSSLNSIFAINADGVSNQFMCVANFNVTAIRPMSVFGSPYSNI